MGGEVWHDGQMVRKVPRLTARSEVRVSLANGELYFYHNDDKAHSFTLPENCGPMTLRVSLKNSEVTIRDPIYLKMYEFQPHPETGFLLNSTQLSCQECRSGKNTCGTGRIARGMFYGYTKACQKCNPWKDVKFPDSHLVETKSCLETVTGVVVPRRGVA